jgi:hypothetical protein
MLWVAEDGRFATLLLGRAEAGAVPPPALRCRPLLKSAEIARAAGALGASRAFITFSQRSAKAARSIRSPPGRSSL